MRVLDNVTSGSQNHENHYESPTTPSFYTMNVACTGPFVQTIDRDYSVLILGGVGNQWTEEHDKDWTMKSFAPQGR